MVLKRTRFCSTASSMDLPSSIILFRFCFLGCFQGQVSYRGVRGISKSAFCETPNFPSVLFKFVPMVHPVVLYYLKSLDSALQAVGF